MSWFVKHFYEPFKLNLSICHGTRTYGFHFRGENSSKALNNLNVFTHLRIVAMLLLPGFPDFTLESISFSN